MNCSVPQKGEDSLLHRLHHSEDGLKLVVLLQLEDPRLDLEPQSNSAPYVIITTNSAVSVVVFSCRRD